MKRAVSVVLLLALVACGSSAPDEAEVPPGGTASYVSDGGRVEVQVTYPATGVVRGENRFRFLPTSGATLAGLTATMPAHGHRVTSPLAADGDAFVGAVELAMPGRWELTAGVETPSGSDVLRFSLIVP